MNFFFIVDTSFSMMQVCNHYSLLDLAKVMVERFVDIRTKHHQESKFDRYFLSSTSQVDYDITPHSLPQDSYIWNVTLKTLLISHQNNAVKSIIRAFNILNEFRLLYNHDNFLGGRDPYKIDTSIVIFITDGSNASFADTLNDTLRNEFSFNRWDQQFFTFLLNPLDIRNKNLKNRQAPKNYSKLLEFSQSLSGKCLVLDSPDTIPNFIDTFLSQIRHKISLNFKKIRLENCKYDISVQPILAKLPPNTNPKLEQEATSETELKSRLIIRLSTSHLSSKFSMSQSQAVASKNPFPEDPYYFAPGKFIQKLNLDLTYETEMSYPSAPLYYIDFTKNFVGKLAGDFPLERFEIDTGSDLYAFVCEYVKGLPNSNNNKVAFPVFFNSQSKQGGKMEIFACLRYVRSDLDNSIGMELLVYPLNFNHLNEIWEDAAKLGNNTNPGGSSKMKVEYPPELIQKLEIYFDNTPYYYSNHLFMLFHQKKLGDLINRKWRFYTHFHSLTQRNTDLMNFQIQIKKYAPEKAKKKQEYDIKVNNLKAKRNVNPEEVIAENRRLFHQAKEDRGRIVGTQHEQDSNKSLLSRVLTLKNELFAPQAHEAGPKGEVPCSKPMSKMSNYHEYMAKFSPLKNPHEEDTERKFYKEAIPFGNPFKYVLRSKHSSVADNYEDEAFLTSFNQNPLVERNKGERGVSPRGPQKPSHDPNKEKHRISTQNFNLKSLQNALEESSGRSTPVSSPSMSSVGSGSTMYSIEVPIMEEQKILDPRKRKSEAAKPVAVEKINVSLLKRREEPSSRGVVKEVPKVQEKKGMEKVDRMKKVNPAYFMISNASVFRDFAVFLKDPPKPSPKVTIDDHVRKEGLRIIEVLDVQDSPEILEVVLKKLEDMIRVYNYKSFDLMGALLASVY